MNNIQEVTSLFIALFAINRLQQDCRKKQLRRLFSRRRRALKATLKRLCFQERTELLLRWKQINSLKQIELIAEGIRYRRIWQLERSSDFWKRIVNCHYTEKEWIESFRMSKESFIELCDMLRDELEPEPQFLMPREPISVEKQVAVALYKLASTAEYRVIGNAMGIHKSSVKKCLYRVIKAINKVMLQNYINMPNENEANLIASNFENKCFIPQIIGSIDGTHIEIIPPKEGYRDFINRKGWPSYNVLAIVDHNGRFRNIVIKHPGSCHDAAVLKESMLYKDADTLIPKKTRNINGMEIPFIIVGDPAYPLLPWLIKGFSGSLSSEEESFNVYLNSARVSIEMAFGRLKARWRILHKINCDYSFAPEIIAACCVLHNFLKKTRIGFTYNGYKKLNN
ncbi:protein ALP1-like isoform X2 [Solenopsis invicta]|uniref:protein ALP1-like isoform X1 n=1 Tax=Solenopsis invicta TaxID=13686 RepID=UPI00193D326F|nr:protein ALP1-like isoform X1 [Solenopsis invicta]XP_039308992.1 protein ALP1-like isoform X2 [Solenopsis invicta]